jgi:hypothetical protein
MNAKAKKRAPIKKTPLFEQDSLAGFTTRVLMSLANDVVVLESRIADVRIMVAALAKEYDVRMPAPEEVAY